MSKESVWFTFSSRNVPFIEYKDKRDANRGDIGDACNDKTQTKHTRATKQELTSRGAQIATMVSHARP